MRLALWYPCERRHIYRLFRKLCVDVDSGARPTPSPPNNLNQPPPLSRAWNLLLRTGRHGPMQVRTVPIRDWRASMQRQVTSDVMASVDGKHFPVHTRRFPHIDAVAESSSDNMEDQEKPFGWHREQRSRAFDPMGLPFHVVPVG